MEPVRAWRVCEGVTERYAHLTRLRSERDRVSELLASLEGDTLLNKRRVTLMRTVLAALESAIWFEEAR